ncbi:MAG: tetratricopeptide repeat protein, partial [Acidimicrobiales bacterium]
ELGDVVAAERAFDEATLRLGSEPPALLSRRARLAALRGDAPAAADIARQALIGAASIDQKAGDAAFWWLQLAHYEFRIGSLASAESAARSALEVDAGNLGATELLAKIVSAQGDDSEAIELYADLLERGPAADLHGELAKVLTRSGRPDEALVEIEAGLALAHESADEFPAERRHLIGFLADHDPEEALRLAALDLAERQDVYSHAWYAWALHRTGDASAALDAIGPALAFGTDDPWLLYQAGQIHAVNGNGAEAADLLGRALELNPVFDVVHAPRAAVALAALGG